MARYAYDVNTTQRLIDVHKQFQGGLKTVDTDDALGAVFLRQAENVSLSEFGFIEKRYGTFENFKEEGLGENLQGYWEFKNYRIVAVDGILYYSKNGEAFSKTINFEKEFEDFRYPNLSDLPTVSFRTIPTCTFEASPVQFPVYSTTNPSLNPNEQQPVCEKGAFYYSNCTAVVDTPGSWLCTLNTVNYTEEIVLENVFQKTRDMNATSINDTLYIFTGSYPIYAKVTSENELKFYLMPITIPSQAEIIVAGHNLLEYDYDDAYRYSGQKGLTQSKPQATFTKEGTPFTIESNDFSPRFPFSSNGALEFQFDYRIPASTANNFNPNLEGSRVLNTIELDSVGYRTSGPGATSLDFSYADLSKTEFVNISNYSLPNPVFISEEIFDNQITLIPADAISTKKTKEIYEFQAGGNTLQLQVNEYDNTVELPHIMSVPEAVPGQYFSFKLFKESGEIENPFNPFDIIDDVKGDRPKKIGLQLSEIARPYSAIDDDRTEKEIFKLNTTIEFLPYNDADQAFPNNKIIIDDINLKSGYVRFQVPAGLVEENVAYYKVTLFANYTYAQELPGTGDFQLPPFRDVFAGVHFAFARDIEISGLTTRRLSASKIPTLDFKLNDLLPGTFDFEVNFVLTSYEYIQSKDALRFLKKEIASTIVSSVPITEFKYEDYPGVTEDFIPKIKPIWTCNKVIEHFGKLMVWGSEAMPTAVFYSFPDRPTYFPSKFYLDFSNDEGSPVQAVSSYMNILVVQTEDRTWGVRGNSGLIDAPAPYTPFTINPTVGTIAYKSVRPVRNHLFFLSKQGVIALKSLYAADEQYNIDFMDRNIRNIVRQDTKAVGIQFDNQYWLNFPNFGITLRWYIDKKAWVQDTHTAWNTFKGVFKWQIINGKLEYITYPSRFESEGNLGIYKVGVDYTLPTDLTLPISAKFETSFLNQNYPFHPKNYKEAKLDFTLQNEYNLGREAIYQMFTDEDIVGNIHTIQENLIKNHRYRLEYDFTETEVILYDGGTFETSVFEFTIDANLGTDIIDCKFFTVVEQIDIGNIILKLEAVDYTTVEFVIPNNANINQDLNIYGDFVDYQGGAYLRDVTYDDSLTFNTWVLSEEQTLNLDNYEGYNPALINVGLDLTLKDRLGDWVFGSSDFGNKVTAIKTIKLSGRGYNSKIYVEDFSKSKWTLESLGITYKMKRARSR